MCSIFDSAYDLKYPVLVENVKILVTGGSGFIGTNMIEYLLRVRAEVINIDISKPRCESHLLYWKNIDILDLESFESEVLMQKPDYIIHLAARTDLKEKKSLDGYRVNIDGVRNVMHVAAKVQGLRRIVLASSMLVCKLGYIPIGFDDYAPNSLYGQSKVLTEKIIKYYNINWTIVRPTSIWGPWFGEPYKNFFELVMRGIYFNIPNKYASTKTYGYVENTCGQIYNLMISDNPLVDHNYYYLGDLEPINISDWAIRIRELNGQSKPVTFPIWILKSAAIFGDTLTNYLNISNFPMTTFRFKNMTNDNIIPDLNRTAEITQLKTNITLDEQIQKTLNWLKTNNIK